SLNSSCIFLSWVLDLKFSFFALIVIIPKFVKKVKKVPKIETFLRLSHQTGKLGEKIRVLFLN
ncbi:hypothetical protein R7X53_03280, partial [Mesomycoplasma ovipneumoniae]